MAVERVLPLSEVVTTAFASTFPVLQLILSITQLPEFQGRLAGFENNAPTCALAPEQRPLANVWPQLGRQLAIPRFPLPHSWRHALPGPVGHAQHLFQTRHFANPRFQ
jgi:hypothetical protein